MVNWLHLTGTFTVAAPVRSAAMGTDAKARVVLQVRWDTGFTETSLEELPAARQPLFSAGCESDSLQHRGQDVSMLRASLSLASYTSSWFCCILIFLLSYLPRCHFLAFLFFCLFVYLFIHLFGLVICLVFFSGTEQREAPCLAEMCWLVLLWWDSLQLRHGFSLAPWLLLPVRLSPPGVWVWKCHTLWQGEFRFYYVFNFI